MSGRAGYHDQVLQLTYPVVIDDEELSYTA